MPLNPATGAGSSTWLTDSFTPRQIEAANGFVSGVGTRCGPDAGGLLAFDFDGKTAMAFALAAGCDPASVRTWRIGRPSATDRIKVVFRAPEAAWAWITAAFALVGRGYAKHVTFDPGPGEESEQIELFWSWGQIAIAGCHRKSGDHYDWDGTSPRDLAEIPPEWEALLLQLLDLLAAKASAPPPPAPAAAPAPAQSDAPAAAPGPAAPLSEGEEEEEDAIVVPLEEFISKKHRGVLEQGSPAGCNHEQGTALALDLLGAEAWLLSHGAEPQQGHGARDLFDAYVARSRDRWPAGTPFNTKAAIARFENARKRSPRASTPEAWLLKRLDFHRNGDPWEALRRRADEMIASDWPIRRQRSELRAISRNFDLGLASADLDAELEDAERRARPEGPLDYGPGRVIKHAKNVWAVEGLIRWGINLVVGQSGIGKSRFVGALGAAYLKGDDSFLGRPMAGPESINDRHLLVIGTDQNSEDWRLTLEPVGLCERISDEETRFHPRVTLWDIDHGVILDPEGLRRIRQWCDAHPGGMVILDSFGACLPPGYDENKVEAARPIRKLQAALGSCWCSTIHHPAKDAGKAGIVGVGAGAGSGRIDAAFSRVIGMALIHRAEHGVMVPQVSDPRRRLVSQKRGGADADLVITSNGAGEWSVIGTGLELRLQEQLDRKREKFTDGQKAALAVLTGEPDKAFSVKEVVEALGIEWDPQGSSAITTVRRNLKRLDELGLADAGNAGRSVTYRAVPQPADPGQEDPA